MSFLDSVVSSRTFTWIALSVMGLIGCGPTGPQGGPRVETIPVTGKVIVDGAPAAYLRVLAVPNDAAGALPMDSACITTTEGMFSLSTYESGDGVPVGSYKLIFSWGQINLMNGQYSGDKFKGKYSDASKSEYSLTIESGDKPLDLGTIELSTTKK